MSFIKNFDFIDWLIIICGVIILCLSIGIAYVLYNLISVRNLLDQSLSNLASTQANLIVAIISIIAILLTVKYTKQVIEQTKITIRDNKEYNEENLKRTDVMIKDNREYNHKSLNQTSNLIEQNEKNLFIQLRFHNAEKALYTLMNELQLSILIYYDLKELASDELFFNPRGFLLAQYLNLVSDIQLLEFIPLKLRSEFQYNFLNRLHNPPSNESEAYIEQLNLYKSLNKTIIIQSKIIRYYEFEKVIKKFNENCISGHFLHTFKLYYSSCISEIEMEEHMKRIITEIANHKPEELIMDEMNLEIIDLFYSD